MEKESKHILNNDVSFFREQKYFIIKSFIMMSLLNLFISYAIMVFINISVYQKEIRNNLYIVFSFDLSSYLLILFIIEIIIIIMLSLSYYNKFLNSTRNYGQHGKGILKFLNGFRINTTYIRGDISTYPCLDEFSITDLSMNNKRGYVIGSKDENTFVIDTITEHNFYVEGGTGAGKTELFLKPTIFSLSVPIYQETSKPIINGVYDEVVYESMLLQEDMFITDPKGQLSSELYSYLMECGYEVIIVNTINPLKSSNYNPLELIYKTHEKINNIKFQLTIENREATYDEMNIIYELESEKSSYISSIAEILTTDPNAKDKFWSVSAKEVLISFIFFALHCLDEKNEKYSAEFINDCKNNYCHNNVMLSQEELKYLTNELESVKKSNKDFTELNITSMIMFIQDLMMDDLIDEAINELEIFNPAKLHYSIIAGTQGETRGAILTTLLGSLSVMFDESIANLTSKNTMDFESISEGKPKAIFLVVPDEDKSRHFISSIFIEQLYTSIRKSARFYPNKKLPRRFNFLLEEVANVCDILNYSEKLSVARSSNIRFANLVQAKTQLVRKIGKEATNDVLENCHVKMTLLASNNERIKEIQDLSGEKTITVENTTYRNSSSNVSSRYSSIMEKKVLSYNQIRELQFTEAIIDIVRYPMIMSTLIPSFMFLELNVLNDISDIIVIENKFLKLKDLVILKDYKKDLIKRLEDE